MLSLLYKSSFTLFEHLGITKKEELPNFSDALAKLEAFSLERPTDEPGAIATEPKREEDRVMEVGIIPDAPNDEGDNLDANIQEEDLAGDGFDDPALSEHKNTNDI